MKYRHHTGVRLSLVSGHATFVGPDWRALHERYHHEALAKGCECDQQTIRTRELAQPITGPNAITPLNEAALIRAGFERMLARNGEDDFTFDGIPNLEVLGAECGFNIDRQTALEVWNLMVDEATALQAELQNSEVTDQAADVAPDLQVAKTAPEAETPPVEAEVKKSAHAPTNDKPAASPPAGRGRGSNRGQIE